MLELYSSNSGGGGGSTTAACVDEVVGLLLARQATSPASSSFQTVRSIGSSTARGGGKTLTAEEMAKLKVEDAAADEEACRLSSCFACMARLKPYSHVEGHPPSPHIYIYAHENEVVHHELAALTH